MLQKGGRGAGPQVRSPALRRAGAPPHRRVDTPRILRTDQEQPVASGHSVPGEPEGRVASQNAERIHAGRSAYERRPGGRPAAGAGTAEPPVGEVRRQGRAPASGLRESRRPPGGRDLGHFNAAGLAGGGVAAAGDRGPPVSHPRAKRQQPARPERAEPGHPLFSRCLRQTLAERGAGCAWRTWSRSCWATVWLLVYPGRSTPHHAGQWGNRRVSLVGGCRSEAAPAGPVSFVHIHTERKRFRHERNDTRER